MNKNKKNQAPATEKLVLTPTKQEVVTPVVIEEVKTVKKPNYRHKRKVNTTNTPIEVQVTTEKVAVKVAVKPNWFKTLIIKIKALFTKKK